MTSYAGKNTFVLVGKESTFNTAVTANKEIGLIQNVTVDENNNTQNLFTIGNRQAEQSAAGAYEANIRVSAFWQHGTILELMFGQATDAVETNDDKHTFVDAGTLEVPNGGDSFTLQTNFDASSDVDIDYAGCKINSITFTLEEGGIFTWEAEIIGSSVATGTSVGTEAVSSLPVLPYYFGHLSTGDEASESELSQVKRVSITLNQNIDAAKNRAIGSRVHQELQENLLEISGEFTMVFQNKTEYERFLGGTTQSTSTPTDTGLILSVHNGVAAGSGRREFNIALRGVQYTTISTPIEAGTVIEQTFSFTARTIEDLFCYDNVTSYF